MNPSHPDQQPDSTAETSTQLELGRLEQAIAMQASAQKRTATAVFLVSASMLILICIFALVNYNHFKKEWTEEKFAKSIEKEFQELNPQAIHQLKQLGERLLPIYANEGKKQFLKIRPEITNMLRGQVDLLADDLKASTHARLLTSEARVREASLNIIIAAYPDMKLESERLALDAQLRKITEESVTRCLADFDKLFAKDVAKLRSSLEDFEVHDDGEPIIDLQKRFISLWLQLLDEEIRKL